MKAGRELDALVAEKVMGLPVTWQPEGIYTASGKPFDVSCVKRPGGFSTVVDHYSTSIIDAWQVVERLKKDNFQYFVIEYDYPENGMCGIYFHPDLFGRFPPDVVGESVPHAICLAALKAVEVANPDF